MNTIITITLTILYVFSALQLCTAYGNRDITLSFWSIFSLFIPIVNTAILVYLIAGHTKIGGFRDFIRELREKRDPE